jgi:hypothetical protein
VGAEWQRRLGVSAATVGTREPALSTDWRVELTAAASSPSDYRVPNGLSFDELAGVVNRLAKNDVEGVEVAEFEETWAEIGKPGDARPLLDALSSLVES